MRIATKTMYDNIMINLNNSIEAMNKANMETSSGKRINSLADDPAGLAKVLNLNSRIAEIEQIERNISMGQRQALI